MAGLESVFRIISDLLWNHVLLVVLVGLGIFYTILTGGIQVRCFGMAWKSMLGSMKRGKGEEGGKGTFSSYQTLCTAVASCVGSGNIVGVATAILAGGPGALFWMWAAAFFGMATKFAEITLGVRYHGQGQDGSVLGGPMYYASLGLNWKHVGVMIASCLFIQNAGATLVQSNTISQVASEAFRLPLAICALGLAAVMTFIISGGLKRLVHIAERVVPFMAGFYVAGGLVVLLVNLPAIPGVIGSILEGAFSLEAGAGAAAGISMREAMRYGVARGLYSNEAGEGSAAVLHASAEVDHPVRQGVYGILEVFIDTMIICSTTGFAILVTGADQGASNASTLAAEAFGSVFPAMKYVIYISLILFAATSIMSQWYFGHVSLSYLKKPKLAAGYRIAFPFLVLIGSMSTIDLVWLIQDCALAFLVLPNAVALIALAPQVRKMTKEFLDPEQGFVERKRNG